MSVSCINCKHSICNLRVVLSGNVDFEEYIDKAQSMFNSSIISVLKENSNFETCTIKSINGKELKDLQINLAYECKLGLEDNSPECQCNFTYADYPSKIVKTIYRKKQSTQRAELNLYDTE